MIKQRLPTDCAICTIAMALGKQYDEVMAAAVARGAFDPAEGVRREYHIIEQFGLKMMTDFRVLHRMQLAPEYFRDLAWGRPAILAVPSLNIDGGSHSVYWSGTDLFDPCTLKTYSGWNELRPDEIILFGATALPSTHRETTK